jgi:hypothetical protein
MGMGRRTPTRALSVILALRVKEARDLHETSVEVTRPVSSLAVPSGVMEGEFFVEFEEPADLTLCCVTTSVAPSVARRIELQEDRFASMTH